MTFTWLFPKTWCLYCLLQKYSIIIEICSFNLARSSIKHLPSWSQGNSWYACQNLIEMVRKHVLKNDKMLTLLKNRILRPLRSQFRTLIAHGALWAWAATLMGLLGPLWRPMGPFFRTQINEGSKWKHVFWGNKLGLISTSSGKRLCVGLETWV